MKKRFFCLWLISLCWVSLNAQTDSSFKLIRTIKGHFAGFSVDNLDNVYLITKSNQLKKINANGDSVGVFNDVKKFGKISLIDVSNPLKILLYYNDFGTVLMLDRFLNRVNAVDLRKTNIFQAKAIAQSYDNKIWVYDELENKLKKISEDGSLLQETIDLRLILNQIPAPQKIFDQNQFVYLYDSAIGVCVLDYYGTLKNIIRIQGWENLKVSDRYIFGSKNNLLYRYDIRTYIFDEWKMPQQIAASSAFSFSSARLYALKADGVEVYEQH